VKNSFREERKNRSGGEGEKRDQSGYYPKEKPETPGSCRASALAKIDPLGMPLKNERNTSERKADNRGLTYI